MCIRDRSYLVHETGADLVRYATVLQQGRFAAAYLGIGLGRSEPS